MAGKQIRISEKMLFVWFMLAGFILLFSPQALTSRFQFGFARLFRWPLSAGRNVPLSARTEVPLESQPDRKEAQYQNYIANLEEELRQKNYALEQLSGMRARLRGLEGAKLVSADIITSTLESLRGELIINRGNEDGLAKDLFVLGDNSIIGRISDVAPRNAKVMLLTDAASTVQVNIPGVEVNMLMQGAGNNTAKIRMVPVKHKIKAGDVVMARRKPGLLDTAMVAGAVQECKRDGKNAGLWDVTVKPACDIGRLDSVAVIIMTPQAAPAAQTAKVEPAARGR